MVHKIQKTLDHFTTHEFTTFEFIPSMALLVKMFDIGKAPRWAAMEVNISYLRALYSSACIMPY